MRAVWFGLLALLFPAALVAQVIPHAQDKPPNEPRDALTAAKMMTVPDGFVVDVVASEPDIVNPVAMTIDERGRFWITESLEYPRKSPGPGKDRVKILEDTDGNGKMDKFSIFLDGLNIPSGVAVGHGGVWIANSPDILFVPDADRDGKPDGPAQVVVTGFGRTDTHELPNSLTWGPDGWLYGLNGVFNYCDVKYAKENPNFKADHPGWKFTCAMFRIHPRTREFQIFCEGTSNPWGIAFNDEGDAFVSACVIDHLWHLVETGYYHRQGGPYPPHTWKIDSIVKHKHQKAAYCGITWFDSDAYPEQYRKKLYMGNIHGGCINVDRIERNGSTYAGFGEPDFLTANDAWFMPVVQKTGPDGCLYILDWYDRYHCYQDANRDPAGIDRLKGRLYRVRYQGNSSSTRAGGVSPLVASTKAPKDLAAETDDQLIERLGHPNVWMRETAQRLLQERNSAELTQKVHEVVYPTQTGKLLNNPKPMLPRELRLRAVFSCALTARNARGKSPSPAWANIKENDDPALRAWSYRIEAENGSGRPDVPLVIQGMFERALSDLEITSGILELWKDEPPEVRLQWIIYFSKVKLTPRIHIAALLTSLSESGADTLLPRIIWQQLHPLLEDHAELCVALLRDEAILRSAPVIALMPRIVDRILARQKFDAKPVADLFALVRDDHQQVARDVLAGLATKVQSGELKGEKLDQLKAALADSLQPMLGVESTHPLRLEASLLAISWRDPSAVGTARVMALNAAESALRRLAAYNALIAAQDGCVEQVAREIFSRGNAEPPQFVGDVLGTLGRSEAKGVGDAVMKHFPAFPPELQPRAVELLTQRPAWSVALLESIGDKKLPASVLNVNQARKLFDSKDEKVRELLAKHWGQVREGRSPDRDKIIGEMRAHIRQNKGDALAGEAVFKKVCAQCHKMYGEGVDVGPDITLNGRNDYTQLLSNVFDPSLVIGAGYRSFTVATDDGRVINGLLAEESPQRIVLKVQGGKQEIIPRDQIDVFKVSETSLMPEQLEKQITPTEMADLFAYITLDKPPRDPQAKRLPGVYDVTPRESKSAGDFAAIFQEVAPGFTEVSSGEGGVALLKEHMGRPGVVRTHPVSRDKPAEIAGKFAIPAGKKTTLTVDVSHDARGDWRLVVSAGGRLIDELVNKQACKDGWATFTADLTKFAGQEVQIRMANQANDWSNEFAYWGSVRVVSE